MELENKIKCVLIDFEINEITLQEATKRILLLLDVVGRSEQLECAYEGCSNHCKMPDKHGHCCDCQEDLKHTSN
jgi:hypothetical protein